MTWSPLALADLHLNVLYERDEAGLLVRVRSTTIAPPSFHLVRTVDGNRWLISAAMSKDLRAELKETLSHEPVVRTLAEMERRPPLHSVQDWYRGPAFVFPNPLPVAPVAAEVLGDARRARTVPELSWVRDVTPAERPATVVRSSSGEVVSVCHSARATDAGAEAGVETANRHRGRGLAGAVVAAWATAILAEGRLPLYSTQWTNRASRGVARKLGLIQYGEDCHD